MNPNALIFQAKSFYNAYIALEHLDASSDKPLLFVTPMLVNGAFSIELGLKAILVKNNIDYAKEHNMFVLFNLLPECYQYEILNYIIEKTPEYKDPQKFGDEFLLISNVFVDWRYCFEKSAPAVDIRFISAFANASIRCLLAHYNVDLVEITDNDETEAEIDDKFARNRKQYIETNLSYIRKKYKEKYK